jgi:hypothetical protein
VSSRQMLKEIDEFAPWGLFLLMAFGVCASAHWLALAKVEMTGGHFALMNDRTVASLAVVGWMQDHIWVGIGYLIMILLLAFYLHARHHRRCVTCLVSGILSAPCLAYGMVCSYIMGKVIGFQ